MSRHGAIRLIDAAQNPTSYIPIYDPSVSCVATTSLHKQSSLATRSYGSDRVAFLWELEQKARASDLIITGVAATQNDYVKQFISLVGLTRSYSVVDYTMITLVDKPSVFEPIVVRPPKKRVLASMRVRLSSRDFRRRLPKPVISV